MSRSASSGVTADTVHVHDGDMRIRARALAGLFAAGATLALLTVLLPHAAGANEAGLLTIIAVAYAVALGLWRRPAALPPWVLPVALALGTTLITMVAYLSDERPSPLIFFYLWVFLYSAYFFDDRTTLAELTYVGAASGALLVTLPPAGSIAAWWIVAMGTLVVATILIRTMRGRVEELIGRLYESARTDSLTELPNRRGFRELLDLELERARRRGAPLTVLVGDLDHFNAVNDRCGHRVGDAVLVRVAHRLREGKRRTDAAARVGGEEFMLILPDTDHPEGLRIAERLRVELAQEFADEVVPLTISFGVAIYPQHGQTAASLLRAGDEAMFAAKYHGRNQSLVYTAAAGQRLASTAGERDVEGERFTLAMLDLAEAVDLRFSGSARHSETVGRYAEMTASALGLPEERIARVRLAGILHDVGKVLVPEAILKKPGSLTDEEFELIKHHPGHGGQIIDHPALSDVRAWVVAHHERPDGRGYPLGLSGDELPIEARILAVADAYEAMTCDRSYRAAIGHGEARTELERCAGSQFDPDVVAAFVELLQRDLEPAPRILPVRG